MEEFFAFLRLNKITANGYHALYKLTETIGQKDIMNFVIELHKLEIDGYITRNEQGLPNITIKGINVLTQGKKFFATKKKLKTYIVPKEEIEAHKELSIKKIKDRADKKIEKKLAVREGREPTFRIEDKQIIISFRE